MTRSRACSHLPLIDSISLNWRRPRLRLKARLFLRELVRHVVFIDIADVLHRLPTHVFGGNQLDIAKPLVRIESFVFRSISQAAYAAGPALYAANVMSVLFIRSRPDRKK
jgi:hypothetical protein